MQLNLPEIHKISADDMKKIFPSKYYSKYEHHTVIHNISRKLLNMNKMYLMIVEMGKTI